MTTLAFSAIFGVTPGYVEPAFEPSAWTAEHTVATDWVACCEAEYHKSGLSIGGFVTAGRVAYPTTFSCPGAGEVAVQVNGAMNPAFCNDAEAYRAAVLRVCEKVRVALAQETVLVTFTAIEGVSYLTSRGVRHVA
jgi:hypothetical protein